MNNEPSFDSTTTPGPLVSIPRNPRTVGELGDDYTLVTDSAEIIAILDHIGQPEENSETGCLFVLVANGDYAEVYQCGKSVPYLTATVYRLR